MQRTRRVGDRGEVLSAPRAVLSPGVSGAPAAAHEERLHQLVGAVKELAAARDLEAIAAIVRTAARRLTGADGATFVLRDGDACHYMDEDAVAPLWKGRRFPMSACISGWVMLNGRAVVIEDIYADRRIPIDAYRPTFVKSLAMVPVRTAEPIGAIGNYWARRYRPGADELELLQTLADAAARAIENVSLLAELEDRVARRTAELASAHERLRELSRRFLELQELERRAVARELHDEAGQVLAALKIQLRLLAASCRGCAGIEQRVDPLRELASDAMNRIHDVGQRLRPAVLDRAGLLPALRQLAEGCRTAGLEATFEADGFDAARPLPVELETTLFRIMQEGVANVLRHASATRLTLRVERSDGHVRARLEDDGRGFDPAAAAELPDRFGLRSMRERAEILGARLAIESRPGAGTIVTLDVPVRAAA